MSKVNPRGNLHRCIDSFLYQSSTGGAFANLQASCKNSLDYVQRLDLLKGFEMANGCVNSINWNASGTHFVSGSDDNHIVISEANRGLTLVRAKTQHKRQILCARFMPHSNDQAVISCSEEGLVQHTEFIGAYGPGCSVPEEALVDESAVKCNLYDCHAFGSVYDALPMPDIPMTFLSCGEDATVRCVDMRVTDRCENNICYNHLFIKAPSAVTAMDVAPVNHYKLVIGCSDSIVRVYDRRMLRIGMDSEPITWPLRAYPIPLEYIHRPFRPTCLKFSSDEQEVLVSYAAELLYLFDLRHPGYSDLALLNSGCYTRLEPQMGSLRCHGDWTDTGPNSGDQNRLNFGLARPPLEGIDLSDLSEELMAVRRARGHRHGHGHGHGHGHRSSRSSSGAASDRRTRFMGVHVQGSWRIVENRRHNPSASIPSTSRRTPPIVTLTRSAAALTGGHGGQVFPLATFDYLKMTYKGHRNSRTKVKNACFWGDNFVMSGSDCGHIFIWERQTGNVVKTLLGDQYVVFQVQPHPTLPYLLSSGVDENVKLWAPIGPQAFFDADAAADLMLDNEVMLARTRDTYTVPAHFMVRIMDSLQPSPPRFRPRNRSHRSHHRNHSHNSRSTARAHQAPTDQAPTEPAPNGQAPTESAPNGQATASVAPPPDHE
ncbi:maker312 [Drosophila busckii]|uniref:Maker312 n=1 Tax=Drosophila busckii TaxID=30019 RepID=A0A0M4EMF7_DROBS|nr:maker312 [Drosophila busckii]